MNNIELWNRAIKTFLAGTMGEIENEDIECLAKLFKEREYASFTPKAETVLYNNEHKSLNEYVKESTSVLEDKNKMSCKDCIHEKKCADRSREYPCTIFKSKEKISNKESKNINRILEAKQK